MTPTKRLFDISAAIFLGIVLMPLIIITTIVILIRDGWPVFYVSERMKTPQKSFQLVKFRTMKRVAQDSGVSGADKANRITDTGAFLRRTRIDEVPQLWNVLKGDISFVGPRPPLRQYVERFPEIYAEVLKSRPGITGLATIAFHRHEEWLLARSQSVAETDAIYSRSCVPRKARLDLIYQKRRGFCLDWILLLKAVFKRIPL